ncbi:MAG: LmbU family transcriptional regulator [Candidatus Dormibacteria bacterium]
MTTALALRRAETFRLPGEVSEVGYALPDDLSIEEWQEIGGCLRRIGRSVMWWIGDWLRYGERRYGEMYAQAIEATAYDAQTLRNAVWVAGRIELSRRRDNLSWSHHSTVAALETVDQELMLLSAAQESWPLRVLRREVRRLHAPADELPEDAVGVDEFGAPLRYDDADVPDHLQTVRVECRFTMKVPSPAPPRTRGDNPLAKRESVLSAAVRAPICLSFAGAVREQGDDGLRTVINKLATAIFNDPTIVADWPRLP